MEISKNYGIDTITILPNGGGTKEIFISIKNDDFYTSHLALDITEARQIADEILKICDNLENTNE